MFIFLLLTREHSLNSLGGWKSFSEVFQFFEVRPNCFPASCFIAPSHQSHRHRTRSILDWRVCCLAPLICFIRRDLRDHGPRWRRPRLPAACCTCACGASVRTRCIKEPVPCGLRRRRRWRQRVGGALKGCRRGSMSAFGGKADMPFCTANVRL